MTYIYDFGDNWQHTIQVMRIITGVAEFKNITCTGGKRACPPEDCGSYPGYQVIVAECKLPHAKRDLDLMKWLEEVYDPEYFDMEAVNRRLKTLKV